MLAGAATALGMAAGPEAVLVRGAGRGGFAWWFVQDPRRRRGAAGNGLWSSSMAGFTLLAFLAQTPPALLVGSVPPTLLSVHPLGGGAGAGAGTGMALAVQSVKQLRKPGGYLEAGGADPLSASRPLRPCAGLDPNFA